MQLLKILFLSLLFGSCTSAADIAAGAMWNQIDPPKKDTIRLRDTVFVPDLQCQALLEIAALERDSFAAISGNPAALAKRNDSLHSRLLVAEYKLERVRYYLRIVNRNPGQVKFLRGWLNRALAE